jgi:hypothetical protein
MTLMGRTSNGSDFGTEGNEENEGLNDFAAFLVSLQIFGFELSSPLHRLGRL